jgi:hypothetical protein
MMRRREFIGTALAAGVATAAGAQTPARQGAGGAAESQPAAAQAPQPPKTWTAKVEKLWNIPSYKYMNALESAPDGLWIGDQVTEKACRVDWNSGKILSEVQLESHNISGIAVGGGYIWAGSNGSVSNRRPPRPQDRDYGEFSQLDMKTGKIVKTYRPVWGGGTHGLTYNPATNTLWTAALSVQCVAEMDPKDNLRVLRMFSTPGQRAHGLDLDKEFLYILFSTDREVHKYALEGGRLLEIIKISESEPDAHGLALHSGYLYYCDSGLTAPGPGTAPGQVCRFRLASRTATN